MFINTEVQALLQLNVGDLLKHDLLAHLENYSFSEHPLPDGNFLFLIRCQQVETFLSRLQTYQETLIELSSSSLINEYNLTEALKEIVVKAAQVLQVSRIKIWTINDNFASITS